MIITLADVVMDVSEEFRGRDFPENYDRWTLAADQLFGEHHYDA